MTPADVARVLAKAAAFDQRTVGTTDVAAWHEALDDLDYADALAAVTRHYQNDDKRIMPAHVRRIVDEIRRDRHRAEREAREQADATMAALERGPVGDRSAEVADLLRCAAAKLGPSNPNVLRRTEWADLERKRRRAAAEPNPHFRGFAPPDGLQAPAPDEEESA